MPAPRSKGDWEKLRNLLHVSEEQLILIIGSVATAIEEARLFAQLQRFY